MYQLGDKVKLSEFYLNHYLGVDHLKDRPAEVVAIDIRYIRADDLAGQKEGYQRYLSMYGKKDRYEVVTLRIKYPNSIFIVSQFGVVSAE